MWVVKLSESGLLEWQKSLGGSWFDFGQSIQQTTDGGYIAIGHNSTNDGDVIGNRGNKDMWVVKLSGGGELEWQKSLGGSQDDEGHSIQQTADGGYIAIGSSASNDGDVSGNSGRNDMWAVKLSSTGDIEWQKSLGGSNGDNGRSIHQTADGGYIAAGASCSNDGDVTANSGNGDRGFCDYWVAKLSGSGELQWQKSLGGSGDDQAFSARQTADGGFIAAGGSESNDGDVSGSRGKADMWVVKILAGGELEWQMPLGGTGNDWASAVQQTADGGFIAIGSSDSNDGDVSGNHGDMDVWVVKLGPPAPSAKRQGG
jgi:hypothetical protein